MEIKEILHDGVVILMINGRLDTTNYHVLEERIVKLVDNNQHKILIDCSELSYISSSGLRIMLMGLKKINTVKGKFALCSLQDNIREIFEISGFTSIFTIFVTQEEALAKF